MKFYVTKDVFEKIPDGKFGLVSVTGAVKIGMIDKENMEFETEL